MQVLAFTSGGDGVKSAPIHCQTEQDGEPRASFEIKTWKKSILSSKNIFLEKLKN